MSVELDIVNDMLRATGTSALTASDTSHPEYIKCLATLERVKKGTEAMGMWFNTSFPELAANSVGEVIVPQGTLHADPIDTTKKYTLRGRKLFDLSKGTFVIGESVCVSLITPVDIEDMPFLAYDYIRAKAKHIYYTDEDGAEPKLSRYKKEREDCWAALYREHLKNADLNYFNSPAAQRMRGNHNNTHGSRFGPTE